MAYVAVPTITTGDLITAANGNQWWRDNLAYLKDQADAAAIITVVFDAIGYDTALTVEDGLNVFPVPDALDGYLLTGAHAIVTTASSSGTPTIQLRRLRGATANDMLSTRITIDANEKTSYTAATAPAINASYDDLETGDLIYIDCDVAGTGTEGLFIVFTFEEA